MSRLLHILENEIEYTANKWPHYLPIYEKHFAPYRSRASPENKITLLEIGVSQGGSLDMWSKYFGPDNCLIFGFDISLDCVRPTASNIQVFIGDQSNVTDLEELKKSLPPLDIIIDDGGHTMAQQVISFSYLFDHLKPGGTYLCEDTHTSYWPWYGGGLRQPGSFQEFSKHVTDVINGYHWGSVGYLTKWCTGVHFYDSMVFFDKPLEAHVAVPHVTWHPKNKE
jgi:hypothetical protein